MEKQKIYLKSEIKYLEIPIYDHSSIFLERYSSELKYMAPWTQYDNSYSAENIYSGKKNQQQKNFVNKSIKKNEKDDAEIKKGENDEKYFIGLEKHPL